MWDLKRQTEIKHIILEKYLWAWLRILSKRRPLLYYVDGFAGPGRYRDESTGEIKPGSPVIAIEAYLDHKRKGEQYELKFINVEKKETNWQELENSTVAFKSEVDIENIPGGFLDNIDYILKKIGNAFAFFFIDPFGISGIEFAEIEKVFARDETEILLNFNYDGIQRCIGELANLNHPDPKRRRKATRTIDRVCSMMNVAKEELEEIVTSRGISEEKETLLLRKYRENLLKYKTFVYPLPINYPDKRRTFYYLIFMTSNIYALRIMKDIMKKEKKTERGEHLLFLPLPEVEPENLKQKLYSKYEGRTVEREEVLTDFLPKVIYFDKEDYLARDIDKALNSLVADKDTPVTEIRGRQRWNPYYKFS